MCGLAALFIYRLLPMEVIILYQLHVLSKNAALPKIINLNKYYFKKNSAFVIYFPIILFCHM